MNAGCADGPHPRSRVRLLYSRLFSITLAEGVHVVKPSQKKAF
jgi:hypothetical protein